MLLIILALLNGAWAEEEGPTYNFNFYNGKQQSQQVVEEDEYIDEEEEDEEYEYVDEEPRQTVAQRIGNLFKPMKRKRTWSMTFSTMQGSSSKADDADGFGSGFGNDSNGDEFDLAANSVGLKFFLGENGFYINPRYLDAKMENSNFDTAFATTNLSGSGIRFGYLAEMSLPRAEMTLEGGLGFFGLDGNANYFNPFDGQMVNTSVNVAATELYIKPSYIMNENLRLAATIAFLAGEVTYNKQSINPVNRTANIDGTSFGLALEYDF